MFLFAWFSWKVLLKIQCLDVGWLVVFNVPSTAMSFRDGTPIYCPLRRTWSSINTPFRPGFEPRAVAWQSITLPLRYASSTQCLEVRLISWGVMHLVWCYEILTGECQPDTMDGTLLSIRKFPWIRRIFSANSHFSFAKFIHEFSERKNSHAKIFGFTYELVHSDISYAHENIRMRKSGMNCQFTFH